ncbi:MAG: M50 family metallopeptidase [Actinomycetes bacterium]
MTTLGIVGFVIALLVSVMLHEAGHFLTAKRFGMKVTEFFVGFGPRLWSFRRGETEYGVKAIPAGGYVRIVGMTPLEDVPEADRSRAFYRQPAPQRALVLAAGSLTHFLIALVLLTIVTLGLGSPALTPTISAVSACVPTITATSDVCAPGATASPAELAGIRPGDQIVSVDGHPTRSWNQVTSAIVAAGPGPATVVVERTGRQITLHPDLVESTRPSLTTPGATVTVPFLGVGPSIVVQRTNPLPLYGQFFTLSVKGLMAIPAAVPRLFGQAFEHAPRPANGLTGVVGFARVTGQVVGAPDPTYVRVGLFLMLIASLNVFIGIFNLLPLLPLDGGHLAVLVFEQVRRGLYRIFGRSDPGRVDLRKLMPATYVVLVLLIGLSVLLLVADIVNPLQLPA